MALNLRSVTVRWYWAIRGYRLTGSSKFERSATFHSSTNGAQGRDKRHDVYCNIEWLQWPMVAALNTKRVKNCCCESSARSTPSARVRVHSATVLTGLTMLDSDWIIGNTTNLPTEITLVYCNGPNALNGAVRVVRVAIFTHSTARPWRLHEVQCITSYQTAKGVSECVEFNVPLDT